MIVLHFEFLSFLTTHNTNVYAPGGIRTRNPSKLSAADPRLRPLGYWDRQNRTRDFSVCKAVPESTAPPRIPCIKEVYLRRHTTIICG